MIEGLHHIPLTRIADERGWFAELTHASSPPERTDEVNLSGSRRDVIRRPLPRGGGRPTLSARNAAAGQEPR